MKNNIYCVESSEGNQSCGNWGGLHAGNNQAAKPLCGACIAVCGSGPKVPIGALSHHDNPDCSDCGVMAKLKKSVAAIALTTAAVVDTPSINGDLCQHCKPPHTYNANALKSWHLRGSGKDCTCTKCFGDSRTMPASVVTQKAKGVFAVKWWTTMPVVRQAGAVQPPECQLWDRKAADDALKLSNPHTAALVGEIRDLAQNSRNYVQHLTGLSDDYGGGNPSLPPDVLGCVFVRPCPVRPRHGFVESRCIVVPAKLTAESAKTMLTEINAVHDEAIADDPQAELLVMPYIPAQFNMVATPNQVTIGPGNDGATSGHETLTLPLTEVDLPQQKALFERAGITDYPFFEVVGYSKNTDGAQNFNQTTILTQLRNGPKPRRGKLAKNFVPKEVTVKQVVQARGNLLEWEKIVGDLKDKKGVVVWHPRGSLVSHYAVHCISHEIPIVTTVDSPVVGAKLKPENTDMASDAEPVKQIMLDGIREGLSDDGQRIIPSEQVALLLYAMHNAAAMDLSTPFYARLLGYSFGCAVNLGAIACIGELRHGEQCDHNLGRIHGGSGENREHVYQRWLKSDFDQTMEMFSSRYHMFSYSGWNGSVGGIRWYECAEACLRLWNAICDYQAGKAGYKPMLTGLNLVINVCHNGAKMLTKFVGDGVAMFNVASTSPLLMGIIAAPAAYKLSERNKPVYDEALTFTHLGAIPTYDDQRAKIAERRRQAGERMEIICKKCRYHNPSDANGCHICGRDL